MHARGERVFVDTNIVLYAAGAPHEHKAPCLALMEALASRRLRGITSVEVVVEIAQHYAHHRRVDAVQYVLDRLAMAVEMILPIELEDVHLMLDMIRAHPDFPVRDALHAAVMQRAGTRQILTTDKHFRLLDQVQTLEPQEAVRSFGL